MIRALSFALCVCAMSANAQTSGAPPLANTQLADAAQEARAVELMEQLRCIQCQGQSIHDSDAPIAAAMRHEVRERIKSGKSDAEIERWLVARYGEWVSFAPAAQGAGLLLWVLPMVLLAIAALFARGRFHKGGQ